MSSRLNRKEYGIGDIVWAYRKPYYDSNEEICIEKLVRPFLILSELDNNFLVLPLTTKNKINTVKYNNTYISTDKYYVINIKDIVSYYGYCDIYKNLIKRAYYNLGYSKNKTPLEIKKWLLIEFHNHYILEGEYNTADLIVTFNEHQNYIVDNIKKDGVYAYKIFDNDTIDFTKIEYISNCEIYKKIGNFCIDKYLEKRDLYNEKNIEIIEEQTDASKKSNKKRKNDILDLVEIGSIIRVDGKEFFVIDVSKSTLLCIFYGENYILDNLIRIKLYKQKIEFIKNLENEEKLKILKELLKNIYVMQDTVVQNYIWKYQYQLKNNTSL